MAKWENLILNWCDFSLPHPFSLSVYQSFIEIALLYQRPVITTNTQWYQIKVFSRQHYISLANISIPQNEWCLTCCQFVGLKLHKPFQIFWGTGYAIFSQPHKPSVHKLFSLVLLSIPTGMEMLEPVQHCNRNEKNKVRIYQTKRITSTKIFCAFLYKTNRQIPEFSLFQRRKGLKSKPAWQAEGHLCSQMSKAMMFLTSLVKFILIIASVRSDSETFTTVAM